LASILEALLGAIDIAAQDAAMVVLAELEQAFIGAMLTGSDHSQRAVLDRRLRNAAPWQVRRAESYIEANWREPITIEALAEITGVSMRSLFRTFRQARGCSPLEFARRVRLEKARGMLEAMSAGETITGIALRCGFSNPSRFAKDFARAFGERPSDVLRRSRSR
jgi:transcriptional regulator GlxA family with amidase domain